MPNRQKKLHACESPRCKTCRYSTIGLGKDKICYYISYTGQMRGTSVAECDKYAPEQSGTEHARPTVQRHTARSALIRELMEAAAQGGDTSGRLDTLSPQEVNLLIELLTKILNARGNQK